MLFVNSCIATEKLKMSDEDLIEGYKVCIEKTGENSDISQFMVQQLVKRYAKKEIDKGICLGMIQKAYAKNNYDECLMFANCIVEVYPKDIEGYFWRGYVYELQGKYNEALMEYQTALLIKPNDWGLNVHLGDVYIKLAQNMTTADEIAEYAKNSLKHYEVAIDTFKKENKDLMVLDSEIKKLLTKVTILYFASESYKEYLEVCDLLLDNFELKNTEKIKLYECKAMGYISMGDKVSAEKMLRNIKSVDRYSQSAISLEKKLRE